MTTPESNSEGMPLVLMEAMASALPVVAPRVGGVPDLVEHGRTGWLVGPRDYEGVAQAIARLLAHDDERHSMGRRARERAVQHFALEVSRIGSTITSGITVPSGWVSTKRTARATSIGSCRVSGSRSGKRSSRNGVRMPPATTADTLIPCGRSSVCA